jgi:hypothetical protein
MSRRSSFEHRLFVWWPVNPLAPALGQRLLRSVASWPFCFSGKVLASELHALHRAAESASAEAGATRLAHCILWDGNAVPVWHNASHPQPSTYELVCGHGKRRLLSFCWHTVRSWLTHAWFSVNDGVEITGLHNTHH